MSDKDIPSEYDLDDVELVVYTDESDDIGIDPQSKIGASLGVSTLSLWARDTKMWKEIPLFSFSEVGDWISRDVDEFYNTKDERVSENFIATVAKIVDGETIDDETRDDLTDSEVFLINNVMQGIRIGSSEAMFAAEWCREEYDDE